MQRKGKCNMQRPVESFEAISQTSYCAYISGKNEIDSPTNLPASILFFIILQIYIKIYIQIHQTPQTKDYNRKQEE